MPVKKDALGNRFVEAEVEVPGTPEEVWQAIATGPGVSSWFVPATIDGREGGAMTLSFGPGMDATATISTWEPPTRLVAKSPPEGPNDPEVATEWTVEARSGGTCIVRVVHRWFATGDDWDNQFEGHTHGWVGFFRILRLYVSNFSGQPCSAVQLMGFAPEPKSTAWDALTRPLALSDAAEGQQVQSRDGAPLLAGRVERVGPPDFPELLLRLDTPAPGVGHFFAMPMGGSVVVSVRLFFYGDQARDVVARDEPLWQAWMSEHFPAPGGAGAAG